MLLGLIHCAASPSVPPSITSGLVLLLTLRHMELPAVGAFGLMERILLLGNA